MDKKKTLIHLVRHGAVDNPGNLRYGRLPGFHLSSDGRRSVEAASTFFLNRPIAHIYSSPLERTQQTATLLGITLSHVAISLDDRLLEVKTSAKFEGLPRTHTFTYPTETQPDAETEVDIVMRFRHFLEEKVMAHHGREIIAISHADPIALTKNWALYDTISLEKSTYPHFASISTLVYTGLSISAVWYHGETGKRG